MTFSQGDLELKQQHNDKLLLQASPTSYNFYQELSGDQHHVRHQIKYSDETSAFLCRDLYAEFADIVVHRQDYNTWSRITKKIIPNFPAQSCLEPTSFPTDLNVAPAGLCCCTVYPLKAMILQLCVISSLDPQAYHGAWYKPDFARERERKRETDWKDGWKKQHGITDPSISSKVILGSKISSTIFWLCGLEKVS